MFSKIIIKHIRNKFDKKSVMLRIFLISLSRVKCHASIGNNSFIKLTFDSPHLSYITIIDQKSTKKKGKKTTELERMENHMTVDLPLSPKTSTSRFEITP